MRLHLALYTLVYLSLACEGTAEMVPADDIDTRAPDVERSTLGMGVARLTVRQVTALLKAADKDTTCGFSAGQTKSGVQLSGMPGDDGTATWTVAHCKLSFPTETKLDSDCNGADLFVSGQATLSATRVITGVLTKDTLNNPVAPADGQAITLTLHAELNNFTVRDGATNNSMNVHSGTLDATAAPQVMPDNSSGICTVATPVLALSAISLTNGDVEVRSDGSTLDTMIPAAKLNAQVGQGKDHENWLSGTVQVWETTVGVPTPADHGGLDPKYTRAKFVSSYACNMDLAKPLGGTCPPPREKPAQGAAALSVKLFAAVAKKIDANAQCGFKAPSVSSGAVATGELGRKGSMVFTLPAACTVTFPPNTIIDTDCMGNSTVLQGLVSVTGSKTMTGYITGDPDEPVVPTSWSPAEYRLTMNLTETTLTQSGSSKSMLMHSGSISGVMRPKTALDKSTGACSLGTPIVHMTLSHQDAAVEVSDNSVANPVIIPLTLHTSSLEAQAGSDQGVTNYLSGMVQAAGQQLHVPSMGAMPTLDPDYDPMTFDASFMCNSNLQLPADASDCAFVKPLAEGASRLILKNAAGATQLVNNNGACGFQNQDLLENPSEVVGNPGQQGEMAWSTNCTVGTGSRSTLSTDCSSVTTTVEGTAAMSAVRFIDGRRDEQCQFVFCVETIHPNAANDVRFQWSGNYSEFAVGTDTQRLIIHSGATSVRIRTMQGHNASTGDFDIGTPIAGFDDVTLAGADVTLLKDKKTFRFAVPAADLKGFNGSFGGEHNSVSGTITIDSTPWTLGNLLLQDPYNQAQFDASYACTPGLTATLPP